MAYNKALDKEIAAWTPDGTNLKVSVNSYNGGEPKVRMVRVFERANGNKGFGKAGSLTVEELKAVTNLIPEIESLAG